jgi:hypothetical protein
VVIHGAVSTTLTALASGSAQITIAKATPTLETASSPTGGNIVPGTAVSDTVTVTKATGAIQPTGSVRFILCQPGEVDAGSGCLSPDGTVVPPNVALSAVAPITATSSATANTFAIGTYCWRARYLGDANYNSANHTDAGAECFTTVKQPSTVATLSTPTGGNVVPGTSVTDTVTVTGGPGQPTPTGTVTWFLCQPGEVTAGVGCASPAGTQIGIVKKLNPFGVKISDASTNTAAPGKYCWRVNYSGDGFYQQASHTNTSSECFVVVPECDIYYEYQSSNPLTNLLFNENEVLRAFRPDIAFKDGTIQMFYNDEHTLTLGVSKVSVKTAGGTTDTNCALSAFPGASPPCDPVPGVNGGFACHVVNPDVGTTANPSNPADDAICVQNNTDPAGRPLYPALFITDLTRNGPTACSPAWQAAPPAGTFCGDWQFGGVAQTPDDVFGTWKGATVLVDKTKVPTAVTFTKGANTKKNNYVLGPGADPVPVGLTNEGYGAEIRWNVNDLKVDTSTGTGTNAPLGGTVVPLSDPSLVGHIFRVQFMVHDGDQTKSGGDVGQNCLTVFID